MGIAFLPFNIFYGTVYYSHAVLPSSRPMTPMEQMDVMLKQELEEDSYHGEPSERDMEVNN